MSMQMDVAPVSVYQLNRNKPKASKLRPRERKFVQGLSDGLLPVEAVKQSYNPTTEKSARTMAGKLLKRERIIAVLDDIGLTDEALGKKYKSLLKAKKTVVSKDHGVLKVPDNEVQLNTARTISRIRGHFSDDEKGIDAEPLIISLVEFKGNKFLIQKKDDNQTDITDQK